jgi:hypothetical protein
MQTAASPKILLALPEIDGETRTLALAEAQPHQENGVAADEVEQRIVAALTCMRDAPLHHP